MPLLASRGGGSARGSGFSGIVPIPVEYLVIAGGAAGGQALSNVYNGGGGGAGGYRTGTLGIIPQSTNQVTVGGAGGTANTNGGNSIFSTITSTGGGRGFGQASAARNGGSGGGGSSAGSSFGISDPVTDPVQGYRGGTGNNTGQPGGAGGGASAIGGDAIPGSNTGGAGGAGRASSITGTATTYAGGGSGGGQFTQAGGAGGGGAGGLNGNPGSAGTFYGSAGGGGNGINSTVGGVGFQGVVILKYPATHAIIIGAGLTATTATSGGFKVTTITAGTGNVSWEPAVVPNYFTLNFTASGGVTLTNNLTDSVNIQKTGGTDNSWTQQAYTTQGYTAPLTLEFNKSAAPSGDDGLSYAMIGLNTDPTTNDSYASIDHASYPFNTSSYSMYNNGAGQDVGGSWSQSEKFYLVYNVDGTIKHYNGSKLLYSAAYSASNTVYIDTAFYRVNQPNCRFTNVKLSNRIWNGNNYV
jgi:hypothetical protein